MGVDGVLHREGMQLHLAGDQVELLLGRLVQTDPQEAVAPGPGVTEGVADVAADGLAHAVAVDRLVNNHV